MHRLRSLLSTLLTVVMLLTLISPGFGWEAAAPGDRAVHASGTEGPCDDGAGGADAHHHDHHGCAGHQFSHTPAQLSSVPDWLPAPVFSRAARDAAAGFRSYIPPGLDRPPSAALA